MHVAFKWWVSFTTGKSWRTAARKWPDMPFFIHVMNLNAVAERSDCSLLSARLQKDNYEKYRPAAASFSGQVTAMFRATGTMVVRDSSRVERSGSWVVPCSCISAQDIEHRVHHHNMRRCYTGTAPQSYVSSKHLTNMVHLANLNPRSIRRCQITSQVQSWNARRGPYRHLDRRAFVDNLAVMCNTSVDELLTTYTLVPVRSDAMDSPVASSAQAAGVESSVETPGIQGSNNGKRRRLMDDAAFHEDE